MVGGFVTVARRLAVTWLTAAIYEAADAAPPVHVV